MTWLLSLSLLWYGWVMLRRWLAWQKLPETSVPSTFMPSTKISVIIPVRNEYERIIKLLSDVEHQKYPQHLLEVLVIDDHSDDGTLEQVQQHVRTSQLSYKVLKLNDYVKEGGKKAAVQVGVGEAQGTLLVLTDGDCRVEPEWLREYAHLFETEQPYFISGPVCFDPTPTHFERMQLVEFASLIGVGGASIAMNSPNMCNGANLAYTKDVFQQVNGFAGNENIASGDDEFLLHKVDKAFPGRVKFLKNNKAIVYTLARKTLTSFVQQRVRWASKWKSYQSLQVQLVALCAFMVNFLLFLALPLVLWGSLALKAFLFAYLIKFGIDLLFLNSILSFMGKKRYLLYILPLQLVYIPYVVFTAIYGLFGRYSWKGRTIRTP
ncbi:glycosyltransferase [Pontibacter rugosus]|uniref:Glycosyltransferase n=1 Tax=Pontibacter rugosus TaxID=1745966 RepID=A0ABW3SRX4_9BACT